MSRAPSRAAAPVLRTGPYPSRPPRSRPGPAVPPGVVHAAELAREWAADPARWLDKVRHVPGERRYEPLFDTPAANAWLITWAPGSGIPWHDHGASAATVVVVAGRLTERYRRRGAPREARRVLDEGTSVSFTDDHLHAVTNAHDAPAVSIHVYSPRLVDMTFLGDEGRTGNGGRS